MIVNLCPHDVEGFVLSRLDLAEAIFEAMNGFSAANCIQFYNLISTYSGGTSMDYPEAIVDDDEFMSSDEMSIDVEITTLPTELQSLIFEFQYKSRVGVRIATG